MLIMIAKIEIKIVLFVNFWLYLNQKVCFKNTAFLIWTWHKYAKHELFYIDFYMFSNRKWPLLKQCNFQ